MTRKFVLANEVFAEKCYTKAQKFIEEPNQKMVSFMGATAASIVAEYLANEKGFTLFEQNATYGKVPS